MMVRYRKKRGGSRKSKKIPVLATSGALIFGMNAYRGYMGKADSQGGAKGLAWTTLGVDNGGKFQIGQFIENVTPLAAGVAGSMLASKFKVNRYLSGIPMFKL